MKDIKVVVLRLRWRDLPLAIPLGALAFTLIPAAFLLICLFEKLGWLAFIEPWEERW